MEERKTSPSLLSSLPADLLHLILKCCSSIDDFSAAIQTSKRIYRVYKDHPSSILRSVACNHISMTEEIFPFAFGLVLYHERAGGSDRSVKDWLREDDLSASHLSPSRFHVMVSNHDEVVELEKKFSRSCKDSRFGFSVLSSVEAHRFQASAYLFCQFQALFGIDRLARVSPYKRLKPNWEDGLTRQSFLECIPAMSLLHLSAFKDYLLSWAGYGYQALEGEGLIDDVDLTEEQILHLFLSAGLRFVMEDPEPWAFDVVYNPNYKYERLHLWFATDLDLAIESAAIPPEVKNSDDAKLVIRQGVMSTSCRWCTVDTALLYNNTNYRDVMETISSIFMSELWTNQVEIKRLGPRFGTCTFKIKIPDDLLCELLWPSHIPYPSLEDRTDDEFDVDETVSSFAGGSLPLPNRFAGYMYDPRHMLCESCLRGVLWRRFWSWWEVHRKLPPVSAPDQPDCCYGLDCMIQIHADHAANYNHWCPNTQKLQSTDPSAPVPVPATHQ